jgi:hypothetical protein
MPRYLFACDAPECELQFARALPRGTHESHECPRCGQRSSRTFEGQRTSHSFKKSGAPANSGVSKHDAPTADQVVGRSADEGWQIRDKRRKLREKVRREAQTTALRRVDTKGPEGDVSYVPLGKSEHDDRRETVDALKKADAVLTNGPPLVRSRQDR